MQIDKIAPGVFLKVCKPENNIFYMEMYVHTVNLRVMLLCHDQERFTLSEYRLGESYLMYI